MSGTKGGNASSRRRSRKGKGGLWVEDRSSTVWEGGPLRRKSSDGEVSRKKGGKRAGLATVRRGKGFADRGRGQDRLPGNFICKKRGTPAKGVKKKKPPRNVLDGDAFKRKKTQSLAWHERK